MTRAVLFDVDGVLVHSRFHPDEGARRFWDSHLLEDMGVDPVRFQGLFGASFDQVVIGKRSLVALLDAFLPSVGYKGSTMDFIGYWLARDANLNFQLLDLVKRLRATGKVRVYMATNQEHLRASYLWNELKLSHLFDDMFYAARLGAMKPDREFYLRTEDFLGPQDEPPLLFDDSDRVIASANSHGWEAVLFNHVDDCANHPWIANILAGTSAARLKETT
ncbi:haloacid dehalogenase [Youhaiella tibetensis]|uniref:HAD-IA family hydrolase n=1 Tax=Paradevosia tibetensis TaxID=1447062 RepID=A0A5B9DP50_9HYPH|nr:HAD-IA family hydrolase [Youhaiella tibetensis]AKR56148.1 putative hydrolase (HAD superfamily) [Devosia sp. H5989]QEE21201.1 HAD-IA family hydrolase [Youhaiella tibetensis]GGF17048.1 haloacid dehalogenase [Youhaiella tibetensis]